MVPVPVRVPHGRWASSPAANWSASSPKPTALRESLVTTGILLCLAANWYPIARMEFGYASAAMGHWPFLVFIFVAILVVAFLLEMYRYREPGVSGPAARGNGAGGRYLGVLPCFFVQLRFIQNRLHRSACWR